MIYTSRITSKGTITLPATLRKQLGLQEGDTVELSLSGNTIVTKPRIGWDEFFVKSQEFGKQARDMIANGERQALHSNKDIAEAIRGIKRQHYGKS